MNDSVKAVINLLTVDSTKALLVALFASVGSILAWAVKLKWAEEYKTVVEAKIALVEKNAQLNAELAKKQIEFAESQVKALAEFTPSKMKDHFAGIRQIEEERIAVLQQELEKAKQGIIEKERIISELKQQTDLKSEEMEKLGEVQAILRKEVAYLENQLSTLADREEQIVQILDFMDRPDFSMETVKSILSNFNAEKRWILSEAREHLKQEKEAKLAQTRRAYLKMQKEEKKMSEMRQAMSFDEDQKR
ncbi:hypothetical protein [Phormidesmis priestleyi]